MAPEKEGSVPNHSHFSQQNTLLVHLSQFSTMAGEASTPELTAKGWQAIQQYGVRSNPTGASTIQYGFPKGAQLKTQGSAGEGHMHIMYDTGNIKHK